MENKGTENRLSSSHAISLILTFCSISALFIYLIYSQNIVFGSREGNWVYSYFGNPNSIPRWILICVLVLTALFIYLGARFIQHHEWMTLLGGFVIALAIQVLLQKIYPFAMDQLISSLTANSFYTVAIQHSPVDLLSHYNTLVFSLPFHAKTNMPGKIFLFQFLTLFTSSTQMMGYMIIAISTSGGLLLYGVCKHLFQDKTAALYAFVLYTLVPCKQEFFPILNTVTPVFILLCLYLFLVYLDNKNRLYLVLLGAALYAMVLFEPTPLVMGILFIGITFYAVLHKKISIRETIELAVIPALAFAGIYLILLFAFSFNLWQSFQYVLTDQRNFNINADLPYDTWLRENFKEFFLGVGLPVMMIFIYSFFHLFSRWKSEIKSIRQWTIENIYLISVSLSFCFMLFTGITRAEIARIWVFLAVFFQIPAAVFMAKKVRSQSLFFVIAVTLIVQTAISLQRVRFLIP